jgi:hypothetical protein
MKLSARSVLWLLPLLLTGCLHRTHPAQNQTLTLASAKLPPPSVTPVSLPADATTIPTQPTENAQELTQPTQPPPRPRKPVSKPAPDASTQQAANVSPEVSAIGQLSSGDSSELWHETADSINSTERSVNSINRRLTDSEQVTVTHIRDFLKQAKAALAAGDVDGARTLAAKAKVLLGELIKP